MNNKIKTGYFFGTFNPIHNGHLSMANYILDNTDIDRVDFVISPNSPFKEHSDMLLDFPHRCNLIREAIKDNGRLNYNCIEYELLHESQENRIYTCDTLNKSQEIEGKEYEIALILGEDNFANIESFKNYYQILRNFEIYVCPRTEKLVKLDYKVTNFNKYGKIKGVNFLNSMPINTVSSTFIRNEIKNRHFNTISNLLPKKVINLIKYGKLYQ